MTCSADEKGCLGGIKFVINDRAIKTKRCLITELIPCPRAFVLGALRGKRRLPEPQSSSASILSTPGSAQGLKNFFRTYKSCSQLPQALEHLISSCPWWWPEAPGACCSMPRGGAASRLGVGEGRTHLVTAGPPELRGTTCPSHPRPVSADGEGWAPPQSSAALDTHLRARRCFLSTRGTRTA